MKLVLTELGLSADASEESALAAVVKLKNRVTTLEPFEGEVTKLKNRVGDLDKQNIDSLFTAHGVKEEKVMNRLRPVLANMDTVKDRTDFLIDCGFKAVEAAKPGDGAQVKLFNRDGKAPEKTGKDGSEMQVPDEQQAAKIMNRATELRQKTPSLSLPTAMRMARNELTASVP